MNDERILQGQQQQQQRAPAPAATSAAAAVASTLPSRSGRRRMRPPWKGLTRGKQRRHRHNHRSAGLETASSSLYGAIPVDDDDDDADADDDDALHNNDPSSLISSTTPRRFSSRRSRQRQLQDTDADTVLPLHYYQHQQQQQQTDTTMHLVVAYLEQTLRLVCGAAIAFLLGVWFPRYVHVVEKIAEYAIVAWITCGIIRIVVAIVSLLRRRRRSKAQQSQQAVAVEEEEIDEEEAVYTGRGEHEPLLRSVQQQQQQQQQKTGAVSMNDDAVGGVEAEKPSNRSNVAAILAAANDNDDAEQDLSSSRNDILETPIRSAKAPSTTPVTPIPAASTFEDNQCTTNVHPALEPYFVIDTTCGQRVFPNIPQHVFPLETDYFKGQMMILIRTPNVDDTTQPSGAPENAHATNYLATKQRRFEFQFQLKLKKVPTGRVYFACELQKPVKMGMIQRAFVSAAMAFVKSTNSSFHYNITGSTGSSSSSSSSSNRKRSSSTNDLATAAANSTAFTTVSSFQDDRYERPHMAFPVEEGMNRVVATPPGQPLPVLGQEIVEDAESLKQRKKGIVWNTDDTYTMSLWSAYVDFLDWRCMNLPGIRPFGLLNIIGRQPIYLTLYEMPRDRGNENSKYHYRCDMINIVEFEMCNAPISGVGEAAQKWLSANPLPAANGSSGSVMLTKRASAESLGGAESAYEEAIFPEDIGGPETEEDEQVAAELGEGIYLRSGDAITLKETIIGVEGSSAEEENEVSFFVLDGGGFAVLQERSSATIIIEKTGLSRRSKRQSANSGIIRSGDTVLFKLVTKESSTGIERATKYLSLHRRWWLKWVSTVPTKNGFFTIHSATSKEIHSSYLTLGGFFFLKHKRWSNFFVGAAREGSATYGGRMMGLYNPKQTSSQEYEYVSEDDEIAGESEPLGPENKRGSPSILPLYLEACDPLKDARATTQRDSTLELSAETGTMTRLLFSNVDNQTDVPAWLEILNRTERVRQLVYVVRIKPPPQKDATTEDPPSEPVPIMRLRTGKELSEIMRVGLHWRDKTASPRRKKNSADLDTGADGFSDMVRSLSREDLPAPPTKDTADQRSVKSDGQLGDEFDVDEEYSSDEFPLYGEAEITRAEDEFDIPVEDSQPNRTRKGRKLIGKIAKSVKTRTATTGKQVVKVGRGTVNAGKAIISVRPKNLPREPKSVKLRPRRKVERDLRVSMSNKVIKRVEKNESQFESNHDTFSDKVAGELSASEQSCRTVSKMLSRMSSVSPTSPAASEFSPLLASHLEFESDFDVVFLQGSSLELGVVPLSDQDNGGLLYDCVVARCLWESHWREEWCGVYRESIKFYAPLTNAPCLEVSYEDIKAIRMVDPGSSPLPGAAILALESSWLIHYIALGSKETRQILKTKLKESMKKFHDLEGPPQTERDVELSKARLWQDLQKSLEAARLVGRGKWAEIHSGPKRTSRVVLNNRRMAFDLDTLDEEMEILVEGLLSTALSFTLNSLQDHPEKLSSFLNNCSKLRGLSLQNLENTSLSTLCTVVNLYHCLLQHALLFTPLGPLTKRTYENFMRTCCYEIGEDVYSLAELNSCIIRGHMSRPIISKPPYIEAPKRSASYRSLALRTTTPHLNFLLNTCDVSCTREIPVLVSDRLEDILAAQTARFLKKNFVVNVSKKQIFLPKVCEVYRNDFCSDPSTAAITCLEFCLQYLEEPIASKIRHLLHTDAALSIKYAPAADQYFTMLAQAFLSDAMDGDDPEMEDKD